VPARDEAATIPFSLTGLIEQRYAGAYEIVLADDSSSDDTVAMAGRLASDAEPRLTVVEAGPLPAGWAGKLWTLHRGIEEARPHKPDYYWLTDADIAHKPQVLASLVAHAEAERLALASLMVKLPTRTIWEKLLVPAFIFYFALLYPFRAINDPASRIAGAAGGSLLVRRDALEAIGGIAAIKGAIIDDCALAQAVKGSGRRIWIGLAERSRSLRRYRRLGDFWSMVARSAYPQLDYSPLRLVDRAARPRRGLPGAAASRARRGLDRARRPRRLGADELGLCAHGELSRPVAVVGDDPSACRRPVRRHDDRLGSRSLPRASRPSGAAARLASPTAIDYDWENLCRGRGLPRPLAVLIMNRAAPAGGGGRRHPGHIRGSSLTGHSSHGRSNASARHHQDARRSAPPG
jgi:hypothetical protein